MQVSDGCVSGLNRRKKFAERNAGMYDVAGLGWIYRPTTQHSTAHSMHACQSVQKLDMHSHAHMSHL